MRAALGDPRVERTTPSDTTPERLVRTTPVAANLRKRILRALLSGGAALMAGLAAIALLATCRPAWYRPGSIDYTQLAADKSELFRRQDAVSAALNAGRPVEIELGQAQVNRWLAARGEIWPHLPADALAPFDAPQVEFMDGNRVRIAAEAAYRGLRGVVSVVGAVEPGTERVRIRWEQVGLGRLTIPRRWVIDAARETLVRVLEEHGTVGDAAIELRNEWIWHQGRPRFSIRELEITSGKARIVLQPRGGPR